MYPIKEDGGFWWHEVGITYGAYEKGILPEPGGLGDQPCLYSTIMALVSSKVSAEREDINSKRQSTDKGKQSITDQYLDRPPTDNSLSPDGAAALPVRTKPVSTLRRN